MQITAHSFYYSALCESCGNTITISYRDLRSCFSGSIPDEALLKGSLLCTCEAARPEMSLSSVVPFRH